MKNTKKFLVISSFEGGYQPVTALSGYMALRNAGFENIRFHDTYVDGLPDDLFDDADLVAIAVPLFDALQAGLQLSEMIRSKNASAKIVFFGQYATLNAGRLLPKYGDYAVCGEWEQPLVNLAQHLSTGEVLDKIGLVDTRDARANLIPHPYITRNKIALLDRSIAPPLHKYPQPQVEKMLGVNGIVVGGVESTRGCHHKCTYCSVYATYDGKVVPIKDEIVIEDVSNLVAHGMTHLTFTDAEFFNAKNQGLRLLRVLHAQFPELTYDFTTRIDHILEHEQALYEMKELGVRFITSALEYPSQMVLDVVSKEISIADIERAIAILREIGIRLNPTFIMFNPWVSKEDMTTFKDFITRNDLTDVVDPIQYETRLHLYKGSPLLKRASTTGLEMTEFEFHYEWKHADPEVDALYFANVTPAEPGVFKRCCLKC
jgi:hopanoid C-3 methylase